MVGPSFLLLTAAVTENGRLPAGEEMIRSTIHAVIDRIGSLASLGFIPLPLSLDSPLDPPKGLEHAT